MSLRIIDSIRTTAADALRSPDVVPRACLLLAVVLVLNMDFAQLVLAILGALMYSVMHLPPVGGVRATSSKRAPPLSSSWKGHGPSSKLACGPSPARKAAAAAAAPRALSAQPSKTSSKEGGKEAFLGEVRQVSWKPVAPVQLTAVGFDAEADELTAKIVPSARSEEIVQQLAKYVQKELNKVVPDADVMGFTFSDLLRRTAFGVAVPEVDIIVCLKPHSMQNFSASRSLPQSSMSNEQYVGKIKKMAIRTCTEHLVNSAGFKFRRSAFRGQEPKVTLLAPADLSIHSDSIPIDFSVNSTTPMHHAALLTECGRLDSRAHALALLVKRWAKDRGVCHAAKGHLSPYAWTLMTMYFLQVGTQEEDSILPPVEKFEVYSTLAKRTTASRGAGTPAVVQPTQAQAGEAEAAPSGAAGKKSVGKLLREFFRFYAQGFDLRGEAICVRRAERSPPDVALQLHIVLHADGATTDVAPSIEDPFDRTRNVSSNMNGYGLLRFREELARADRICSASTASFSELLEPWAPPEKAEDVPADASE